MSDNDRPGGMLEISPALDRDLEKAAAGKIPPPPIEAFMSDAALQQAERNTAAASQPLHAEDLRAISPAEAARRTTFDGDHLPPLPSRRRVIPEPFRRPGARGGQHGKTWQSVPADEVTYGDMTELVGKVAGVQSVLRYVTRAEVLGIDMSPADGASPSPAVGRQFDFGDLGAKVAVGTDIILTGIGGVTATVGAASQVRVFRRC